MSTYKYYISGAPDPYHWSPHFSVTGVNNSRLKRKGVWIVLLDFNKNKPQLPLSMGL
jgi:hypothetical protein